MFSRLTRLVEAAGDGEETIDSETSMISKFTGIYFKADNLGPWKRL